jgi:hypothetical protein
VLICLIGPFGNGVSFECYGAHTEFSILLYLLGFVLHYVMLINVRACVRTCVRACVRAHVRACVPACVRVRRYNHM